LFCIKKLIFLKKERNKMPQEEITVRQWIEKFNAGEYNDKETFVQIEAGWYDWFCRDESLPGKTKRLGNIVKKLKDGGRIDLDGHTMIFVFLL
jgi:hypothetical protein